MNFLGFIDQFRYITGALVAVFLFCVHAAPKRGRFALRAVGCYVVSLLAALCYLPLQKYFILQSGLWIAASAPYWLIMSFAPVVSAMFCFEMNAVSALFRCLLASSVETIVTTVVRYLLVLIWFPRLPEEHTVIYILMMIVIYTGSYFVCYRMVACRMHRDDGGLYLNRLKSVWVFLSVHISFIAIIATVKVVCENVILPLQDKPESVGIFLFIRYFCVGVMIVLSVSMLVILYYIYEVVVLQSEKQLFNQLLEERAAQYEFSKENIELINRKCHDLKHQLKALEFAGEEERREMIRETKEAIRFYDAAVKTGNEVLDTILTEKSVLCANRNIRLSCMVNTKNLDRFRVIDLYTMLGNAIDNAIESVEQISDEEKRIISLSIQEQGGMTYISVENYYEGEIVLRGGYPATRKEDSANHGFGVRSIHMLAKRYGGDIRISTQNQIFLLQVILPA